MRGGGLRFQKPPIDITSTQTDVSNVVKLVNLRDDDYVLDDGIYKRVWNVIFYTFDDNVYHQQIIDGHSVENLPSTTRDGYTFNGWIMRKSWNVHSEIVEDTELHADYSRSRFIVSVDANGGSGSSESTYEIGTVITEPATERANNTFVKWIYAIDYGEYAAGQQVTFPISLSGDLYIRAVWNVTVTFISAGDTYTTSTIQSGTTVSQPNNPSRTGYDFNYWMLDNQQFNFSNVVSQDTTLTARYTPITYNITYILNGATQPQYTSFTIESNTFTIPAVSNGNLVFEGWSGTNISGYRQTITINKGSTGDREYTANFSNLRYHASFKNNRYTITDTVRIGDGDTSFEAAFRMYNNGSQVTSGITKIGDSTLTYSNGYWRGTVTCATIASDLEFTVACSYNVTYQTSYYTVENYTDTTMDTSTTIPVKIKIKQGNSYKTSGIRAFVKGVELTYSSNYWTADVKPTQGSDFYVIITNATVTKDTFSDASAPNSYSHSVFTEALGAFQLNDRTSFTFQDCVFLDPGGMFSAINNKNITSIIMNHCAIINSADSMFYDCSSLTTLDVSTLDTSGVTSMKWMFRNCSSLTTLDVSSFDLTNVTSIKLMFNGCASLTSLDVSNWNTPNVQYCSHLFGGCSNLTSIDINNFDLSKCQLEEENSMFSYCSKLKTIDISNAKYSNNCYRSMFIGCTALTTVNLGNGRRYGNFEEMFAGCSSLKSINVDGWDATNAQDMFKDCSSLASIDLSSFTTSGCKSLSRMFYGCSSLTSIDLSSFTTTSSCGFKEYTCYVSSLVANCTKLVYLNISNFDTSNAFIWESIFDNTPKLATLVLGPGCDYGPLNNEIRIKNGTTDGYYATGKYYTSRNSYTYTLQHT